MSVDQKILEEIARYNSINKYIMEQVPPPPPGDELGAPPPPGGEAPIGGETPPPAGGAPPPAGAVPGAPAPPTEGEPVDVEADADVEEIGADEEGGEEEIDITDLVDTQKTMSDKQEEYFNNLFSQLSNLESKLGEMDQLVNKINSLETKFDQFRPKTPEEKLELRSLDSGPFKQKLSDFFVDKQEEMKQSGKNEYVLTSDDVEEYSPEEVKTSFNDYEDEDENNMMR
jgi:hypothetical protein